MDRAPTISVLTLNLNGYEPYEARNPILRAWVERRQPDLLSFQEAALSPPTHHQVAEGLEGLGYHLYHQFDGVTNPPRGDGNCIASRWPMERLGVFALPTSPRSGDYPVAALCATIHAPEPFDDILFVNPKTHWQLHLEQEREQQVVRIAQLVEQLGDSQGFPAIVAADFDAAPDRSSIRFMTGKQSLLGHSTHFLDAWDAAGDGSAGFTWTSDNPFNRPIIDRWFEGREHRRRIDYIFVGSPFQYARPARIAACEVVLDRPVDGVHASGHYGVYAEIAIPV